MEHPDPRVFHDPVNRELRCREDVDHVDSLPAMRTVATAVAAEDEGLAVPVLQAGKQASKQAGKQASRQASQARQAGRPTDQSASSSVRDRQHLLSVCCSLREGRESAAV
jgi:hypothetical protein